jgi:hypothetical protein
LFLYEVSVEKAGRDIKLTPTLREADFEAFTKGRVNDILPLVAFRIKKIAS